MSSRGRTAEALAFWALLLLALGLFAWRWSGQASGLSADQAESLVLAHSWVDGLGLRLTAASAFSPGPPNLPWLAVQALVLRAGGERGGVAAPALGWLLGLALLVVALRGAWVWRRPVQLEDALPAVGLSLATATAEAAALGSGASGWVLALAVVAVLMGRGSRRGRTAGRRSPSGRCACSGPLRSGWSSRRCPRGGWRRAWKGGRPPARRSAFSSARLAVAALVFGFRFFVLGALPLEGLFPSDEGSARTLEFLARQSRWFWAALTGTLVAGVWRRFHLRGGGTLLAWVLMTVVLGELDRLGAFALPGLRAAAGDAGG